MSRRSAFRVRAASLGLVTIAALGTPLSSAHAQGDARDPAAAESLFQRGVALLKKDDWVEACKAFDASMKLDPSVGTQINVARCAEHDGRLATAWAGFKKAKALNAETPLEKRKANVDAFVDGEIAKLEPRLPWVTLRLVIKAEVDGKAAPTALVAGLEIKRDDTKVPVEGLGVEVPIDPGKHAFAISAPGFREMTVEVEVAEGEKKEVQLELIPAPISPTETPKPKPAPSRAPADTSSGGPLMIAGVVIGSVGGAGLIASAVTGGLAASDRGTLDDLVAGGDCSEAGGTITCNDAVSRAAAHDAIGRGETLALVNTVTLFAGGGLLATGVVLFAVGATSGPSADEAAPKPGVAFVPVVAPGYAGVALGGAFE